MLWGSLTWKACKRQEQATGLSEPGSHSLHCWPVSAPSSSSCHPNPLSTCVQPPMPCPGPEGVTWLAKVGPAPVCRAMEMFTHRQFATKLSCRAALQNRSHSPGLVSCPCSGGCAASQVLPDRSLVDLTEPCDWNLTFPPHQCPSVLLYTRHAQVCSYTPKHIMPKELQVSGWGSPSTL